MLAEVNKNIENHQDEATFQGVTEKELPVDLSSFILLTNVRAKMKAQLKNKSQNNTLNAVMRRAYFLYYTKPQYRRKMGIEPNALCTAEMRGRIQEIPELYKSAGAKTMAVAARHSGNKTEVTSLSQSLLLQPKECGTSELATRFELKWFLPSLFNFPITFEKFQKSVNMELSIKGLVDDFAAQDYATFGLIRDTEYWGEDFARDYYHLVYMCPEIRERYPLQIKPCPRRVKALLLSQPKTAVAFPGLKFLCPMFWKFPVTLEEFTQSAANLSSVLECVLKDYTGGDGEAYALLCSDTNLLKQLKADYYRLFYMQPAIRTEYELKLKACPSSKKQNLLGTPTYSFAALKNQPSAAPLVQTQTPPVLNSGGASPLKCLSAATPAKETPTKARDQVKKKIIDFKKAKAENFPLDFFSFEKYTNVVELITQLIRTDKPAKANSNKYLKRAMENMYIAWYTMPQHRHGLHIEISKSCPEEARQKLLEVPEKYKHLLKCDGKKRNVTNKRGSTTGSADGPRQKRSKVAEEIGVTKIVADPPKTAAVSPSKTEEVVLMMRMWLLRSFLTCEVREKIQLHQYHNKALERIQAMITTSVSAQVPVHSNNLLHIRSIEMLAPIQKEPMEGNTQLFKAGEIIDSTALEEPNRESFTTAVSRSNIENNVTAAGTQCILQTPSICKEVAIETPDKVIETAVEDLINQSSGKRLDERDSADNGGGTATNAIAKVTSTIASEDNLDYPAHITHAVETFIDAKYTILRTAIASIDKNVPKDCTLIYALRCSALPKRRIWRHILNMTFPEFCQFACYYPQDDDHDNSSAMLELCYQQAIVKRSVWLIDLYVPLIQLRQFILSAGEDFCIANVSPKLLHWSDLAASTDFDEIVRLDYLRNTGAHLLSDELLQTCRVQFYTNCWRHDKWIWREPVMRTTENANVLPSNGASSQRACINVDTTGTSSLSVASCPAEQLRTELTKLRKECTTVHPKVIVPIGTQNTHPSVVAAEVETHQPASPNILHFSGSSSDQAVAVAQSPSIAKEPELLNGRVFISMACTQEQIAALPLQAITSLPDPLLPPKGVPAVKPVELEPSKAMLHKLLFIIDDDDDDNNGGYECVPLIDEPVIIHDESSCVQLDDEHSSNSDGTLITQINSEEYGSPVGEAQHLSGTGHEYLGSSVNSALTEKHRVPEQVEVPQQEAIFEPIDRASMHPMMRAARETVPRSHFVRVPQLPHVFRSLPLVVIPTTSQDAPAVAHVGKAATPLTNSQALSGDNTIFNSTSLQMLLHTQTPSDEIGVRLDGVEPVTSHSLPNAIKKKKAPDTEQVNTKISNNNPNTAGDMQQSEVPSLNKNATKCVMYRRITQFHYLDCPARSQRPCIDLRLRCKGVSLQAHCHSIAVLLPQLNLQLCCDVQRVLHNLKEFHYIRCQGSKRQCTALDCIDVRNRTLSLLFEMLSPFGLCYLSSPTIIITAECIRCDPYIMCSTTTYRAQVPLTVALKPRILQRLAQLKLSPD